MAVVLYVIIFHFLFFLCSFIIVIFFSSKDSGGAFKSFQIDSLTCLLHGYAHVTSPEAGDLDELTKKWPQKQHQSTLVPSKRLKRGVPNW